VWITDGLHRAGGHRHRHWLPVDRCRRRCHHLRGALSASQSATQARDALQSARQQLPGTGDANHRGSDHDGKLPGTGRGCLGWTSSICCPDAVRGE